MKYITSLSVLLLFFSLAGCKKFIDKKPDKSLAVPTTIRSAQALLDNTSVMNIGVSYGIAEGSADNYYLTDANWTSLTSEANKAIYIWGDEIVFDNFPNEWSNTYRVVYISNLVLEVIDGIEMTPEEKADWENVKGSALFFRARSFLNLLTNWANAFDTNTSLTDPGIPLRLSSDFNKASVRASVYDCYQQIIHDLNEAILLLPPNPVHVMRPSKAAAYALLARTYLAMRDYQKAGEAAGQALSLFNSLLNYNTVTATAGFPFPQFNKEVIFHSVITLPQHLNNSRAVITGELYNSYDTNDIRRTAFFKSNGNNTYGFKGSYSGSVILFNGIASDEMYLTRAECYARSGNLVAALKDLNDFLITRYKVNSFASVVSNDQQAVIERILLERRKELLMRDIRWQDIKRLNKEPQYQIAITRLINGTTYRLEPNDNKYALPLPEYILDLSGMFQNPR